MSLTKKLGTRLGAFKDAVVSQAKEIEKKGQISSTAITLITVIVTLIIGGIIVGEFTGAINTSDYSTQTQDFIGNAKGTGFSAMNLLVVGLIVMAASAILAIIFRFAGGGRGK